MRNTIMALSLTAFILSSCTHDPVIPQDPAISFNEQVLPIIVSNCASEGCHDGKASGEEDLDPLQNYDQIKGIVKPGDARGSRLYRNITAIGGEDAMPPGRSLSEEQIRLINIWIMQGAKNN